MFFSGGNFPNLNVILHSATSILVGLLYDLLITQWFVLTVECVGGRGGTITRGGNQHRGKHGTMI